MASETKRVETAAEKLAKVQARERAKHLRALCVVCGVPFGMHTPDMTYVCAMNRS
jgi:hypothetical protein